MEERVGLLWHRLISRGAERRYPGAAAPLTAIAKTAGVLFRAMGGDAGLQVRAASATEHGARRRWRERVAGAGRKVELAWVDGETLYLPSVLDVLPRRELNHDLYLWLIALAAAEPGDDLPWLEHNQQASLRVFARYPGMAPRYQRLREAVMALRPSPERLSADEAAQERLIRQALARPGSVTALPPARRLFFPVWLWLHPFPPHGNPAASSSASPAAGRRERGRQQEDFRRRQAERVSTPENKHGLMMLFRAESIFFLSDYVKVSRSMDEDDHPPAARNADELETISLTRDGESAASRVRFDLDLPSAEEDDTPLGEGVLLPEWHYRKQVHQPDHCRLQPMAAVKAPPCVLPPRLAPVARRLRSQFAALTPARVWRNGQYDGGELDLDACVQFTADRRGGVLAPERGLYRAHHCRDRDLACLLLADMSLSTDAWVSDQARVIDVIRDSLFLFSEALSATGDRFALYGFSSLKRGNVRFHGLKAFAEKYDAAARGRIAAIKPGFYTRMGAAIRHAGHLLEQEDRAQRLLLLLTDGKPNDLDQYEGRYGVEDTRMALAEVRRLGIRPFCVTIDEAANDYLPYLFGVDGYVVIHKPAQLPRELPLLYMQLTR